MAIPVRQDLTCYKGQTYRQNFIFKQGGEVYSLSGLTAKAQIRPSENSQTLTAEFDCEITADEGKLSLSLDAETTAALDPGFYVWDLKMTDENEEVSYWIAGKVLVDGRVTL